MASADTNVLVRLLAADDEVQFQLARAAIQRATRAGQPLYVPLTVLLELEWVLRSHYDFPKDRLTETFASLLQTRELEFQDESAVESALQTYRRTQADFAECLHLACAATAGRLPLMTFDRAASRLPGVRVLE